MAAPFIFIVVYGLMFGSLILMDYQSSKNKLKINSTGKSFEEPFTNLKDENGKWIDRSNLTRCYVKGNGLVPKGILNGQEIFIEKVPDGSILKETLKEDCVVLVRRQDNDGLFIFSQFLDDSKIECYKFDGDDGERNEYMIDAESVIGIAKYKTDKIYHVYE